MKKKKRKINKNKAKCKANSTKNQLAKKIVCEKYESTHPERNSNSQWDIDLTVTSKVTLQGKITHPREDE